jgi:hypothetical protein
MSDLYKAAQQALEALEEATNYTGCETWSPSMTDECLAVAAALKVALEQPEQATVKKSLPVGQEEPEGGWQSAPSPQVTQRIADMPMSEYRRGVNDGFKLGLREGRIKAEDEMREQPEQEPVAWRFEARHIDSAWGAAVALKHPGPEGVYMRKVTPLYTHPPRREWRGLTDEEIDRVTDAQWASNNHKPIYAAYRAYARAIEAALKQKSEGEPQ